MANAELTEFPADGPSWPPPRPKADVTDPDAAARLIVDWLQARVDDVMSRVSGRPVVLLSGGADSSAVLAAAVERNPVAVTVLIGDTPADSAAADVARHFNVSHEAVQLSVKEAGTYAATAARMLGVADPWSVGMAVAMMAVGPSLRGRGIVLTGEGADVATLGGHPPVRSQEEFDDGILAEAAKYWTDRRPAVDIGDVVDAGAPARWCRTMQHAGLLAITRRIDYRAMWRTDGAGRTWDKVPLRMAAAGLGVPEDVAWRPKSPIQRSSGILDAMLTAACEQARELPGTQWGPRPSAHRAPHTRQEVTEAAAIQFWLAAQITSDAQ